MRTIITDKFLWDIYTFAEKAGDILDYTTQAPTMRNFLPGSKNPVYKKYRHDIGRRRFGSFICYLKGRGYIKVKNLEGQQAIILTKEGIDKALKASFKMEGAKKRKDGKWIMLIFDIPANNKKSRALLRSILQNLGYKLFQQSVWISPYDVSEKTEKLLQLHSLDKYVKIFIIEEIKQN